MAHVLCGAGLTALIAGLWMAWPPVALAFGGALLVGFGVFLQSMPPCAVGSRVRKNGDGQVMVVEKVVGQLAVCVWQTAAGGAQRATYLLPDLKRA